MCVDFKLGFIWPFRPKLFVIFCKYSLLNVFYAFLIKMFYPETDACFVCRSSEIIQISQSINTEIESKRKRTRRVAATFSEKIVNMSVDPRAGSNSTNLTTLPDDKYHSLYAFMVSHSQSNKLSREFLIIIYTESMFLRNVFL